MNGGVISLTFLKTINKKKVHYSNTHFAKPCCGIPENQYHENKFPSVYTNIRQNVTCRDCKRRIYELFR